MMTQALLFPKSTAINDRRRDMKKERDDLYKSREPRTGTKADIRK